jgi:hypothetical protein
MQTVKGVHELTRVRRRCAAGDLHGNAALYVAGAAAGECVFGVVVGGCVASEGVRDRATALVAWLLPRGLARKKRTV